MNLLDGIILAVAAFFVVRGIFRGFFRELGSIVGVVGGIWLGIRYHVALSAYLGRYLPAGKYLPLVSFGILFVACLLACSLAGWSLKVLLAKVTLGWLDRFLGAGLAAIKALVVTYMGIVLLTFFVPSQTPLLTTSRLAPLVIHSYQTLLKAVMPEYLSGARSNTAGAPPEGPGGPSGGPRP